MGNNNQRLKGNLHNSRRNYGYNNYKNVQNDEVNSDDEKNNEKNFKISEYDKELSQMLFNEENNEEETNKKKQNKKIGLKEEMQSYAEQIEEEKFMEEINKSKVLEVEESFKQKIAQSTDLEQEISDIFY